MDKRTFIQHVLIRSLPPAEKITDGIRYAESLWDQLSIAGYGGPKSHEPRQSSDWYASLQPDQQRLFDRFWAAYAHKKGRAGAAMRWAQMEPDADLAERIIEAAKRDSQTALPPGQVRKMAQGWLTERRWEDVAAPRQNSDSEINRQRNECIADLAHLHRMHSMASNEPTRQSLADQIEAKKAYLRTLQPM